MLSSAIAVLSLSSPALAQEETTEVTTQVTTETTTEVTEDIVDEEERLGDYDRRYKGFGGVALSRVYMPTFQGDGYDIGRLTGIHSSYLAQIEDSRFYVGFGVGVNYLAHAYGSNRKRAVVNPYKGSTTVAGAYVQTESLFHVPIEANSGYVWRFHKRFMLWFGSGTSVHYQNYAWEEYESGLTESSVDNTTFFWESSYIEGKDVYKLQPGWQAFAGTEFIFGKIPRIGGEWGLGIQGKYQYIRKFAKSASGLYVYDEANSNEYDFQERRKIGHWNLSNVLWGANLNYHY